MNNKGFTFIEIVIVIGIISICLPIVFSMFFITLRTQARIYSLQEVKRNGDYALNTIETVLRDNAAKIISDYGDSTTEICENTSGQELSLQELFLVDKDNNYIGFDQAGASLRQTTSTASDPLNTTTSPLTNNKVEITQLLFSCKSENAFTPPLISINFVVSKLANDTSNEVSTLRYRTKIRLKNK